LLRDDDLDMTTKRNLQGTGRRNLNIDRFRGDGLDMADWEAFEFRALPIQKW